MMSLDHGDDRATDGIGRRLQAERGASVDHRHHPTAQRRETTDERIRARHRDHVADIDHRIDLIGGDRDATSGDVRHQEQLGHIALRAASAAISPGRSYR